MVDEKKVDIVCSMFGNLVFIVISDILKMGTLVSLLACAVDKSCFVLFVMCCMFTGIWMIWHK